MIKSIELTNFKGYTGTYNFTGKDFITGPNRSGKTRILEALEFAFTGRVGNAKQPKELYALYATAGENPVVVLTYDDVKVTRKIVRVVGEGVSFSSKAKVEVAGNKVAGSLKKTNEYLENSILPIAFNLDEFYNMSSTDKFKYLAEALGFKEPDAKEILAIDPELDTKKSLDDLIKASKENTDFYRRQKKELDGAVMTISDYKSEYDSNTTKLAELKEKLKSYQDMQRSNDKEISDIVHYQDKQLQISLRLDAIQQEISEATEECKKMIDKKNHLAEEIQEPIEEQESNQSEINSLNGLLMSYKLELEQAEKLNKVNICPVLNIQCEKLVESMADTSEIKKKIKDTEKEINVLNHLEADIKEHNKKAKEIKESNQLIESLINTESYKHDTAVSMIQKLEAEQFTISQNETASQPPMTSIGDIENINKGIQENISKTEAEIEEVSEKLTMMKIQKKSIDDYKQAEENFTRWNTILRSLRYLKNKKIKEKLQPIISTANNYCKSVFFSDFSISFEDDNGNNEIRLQVGGNPALSGAEKIVSMIAFATVLSQSFLIKALVIDELGVFDDMTLTRLVEKLKESNNFDNIILLSPEPLEVKEYGFNTIEL